MIERWSEAELPEGLSAMFDAARAEAPSSALTHDCLVAIAAAGAAAAATGVAGSASAGYAAGTTATATAAKVVGATAGAAPAALGASVSGGIAKGGGGWLAAAMLKWGLVGLVGGVTALGALDATVGSGVEPAPPRSEPTSVAVPASPPSRVQAPGARVPVAASAEVAPVENNGASPPAGAAPAPSPASELAVEIALVERARTSLRAGRDAEALLAAREYSAGFPGGQFSPEMAYVRMEALERLGDHASAEWEARALVDTYPTAPQRLRAQQLLAPATSPGAAEKK